MTPIDAHRKAVDLANKDIERLGLLFAKVGDTKHTDTPVLRAYRNARRGLVQVFQGRNRIKGVSEVMEGLEVSVEASLRKLLAEASLAGATSAYNQMKAYDFTPPSSKPEVLDEMEDAEIAALDVILGKVRNQKQTAVAMTMADMNAAFVLGDTGRIGVLKPMDVIVTAAFWLAGLYWDSFNGYAQKSKVNWMKQAVAALDERTTRTCLAVHGQVQPINGEFHLTEEPRFADYLPNPPFHHRCRTATVLYLPEYDYGFTDIMERSARVIINERQTGQGTGYRHPADAFA